MNIRMDIESSQIDLERVMRKRNFAVCYSCCKKVEYTECSSSGILPEDARCNVLSGWLTVSQWQGMESVVHYDFCSFGCLHSWVEAQFPAIPKAFLKGFEEE